MESYVKYILTKKKMHNCILNYMLNYTIAPYITLHRHTSPHHHINASTHRNITISTHQHIITSPHSTGKPFVLVL